MSITLISLSHKRIINDVIEKIVPQLDDFKSIKRNIDDEEDDINLIKTSNHREIENEEEESEAQENDRDEKTENLIIKAKVKNNKKIESCLMIIDNETSKILSSFLSLSDLLNTGLFSVESITKSRAPFPKSSAIYMIYPTEENCKIIINDFKKTTKPLYNKINIYFMESIEENILDILVNENIINRIKKCYDLNMSYFIYDKNIFHFGYNLGSNLHILKCPKEYRDKKILDISIKLFTVCSVLNIFPNIIFQLNSYICQFVGREINKRLKNLYKNKKIKKNGILLLTDRTIDTISPALHNYSYISLIYDLLEKNIKPDENKKDIYNNITIENSNGKLDYKDPLWNCYKDLHIAEALIKISEDFDEFKSSNIGQIGAKNNMRSSSHIEFEMKNITTYQEKNKLFNLHLTIAGEVNKRYKSKLYNEIIEHEQEILTGESINGEDLDFDDLYENFIELRKKIKINKQNNDIIRILMTYLYSFNINKNKFNEMIRHLSPKQKKIFKGLQLLNLNCNNDIEKDPYKRNIIESNYELNELKQKKFNVIRAKMKILSIIEDCTKNNLNEEEFQFVEEPENIKYRSKGTKKKIINKFEEISSDQEFDFENLKDINKGGLSQILIYFNIGGLSINEITSIRNLSKTNELGFKIVLGSTGIYSSNQYLKELISLEENQNNEDIIEQNEEEEEEKEEEEYENENYFRKGKNDINIEFSNRKGIKENEDENEIKIEVKEGKKVKKKKGKEKNKKEKEIKSKDKKEKKKKEKVKDKKGKQKEKIIKNNDDEEDEK